MAGSSQGRRLTDAEVYEEYLKEMGYDPISRDHALFPVLVSMVTKIRQDEPRINSGIHLVDYMNICDDDDTMDSFYGNDYFGD